MLLGLLVTFTVLVWSPPTLILVAMAMVAWPVGALEASGALRLRKARLLAEVGA